MKIKSKILGRNQSILNIENRDSYTQKSLFVTQNIQINKAEDIDISCSNLITDGLTILDIKMFFHTNQTIQFEIIGESIVMNFVCGNNVEANINTADVDLFGPKNSHNIVYTPYFDATFEIPAMEKINYFSIILSVDFYSELIHNDWEVHPQFSKKIFKKNSSQLNENYVPFTPTIKWIIHEIKNCKYKAPVKKMYLEAKIKELLILQFETLTNSVKVKPNIEEEDYAKLLEAKLILENNFTNAPTLPELSRSISLNEFKLKKGFKACFKTTIKGYTTKLRMEYAKKLFKDETSNVSEVAYKCGYKDASHFSAAFKIFYGFTPISFRKLSINIHLIFYGLEEIIPIFIC